MLLALDNLQSWYAIKQTKPNQTKPVNLDSIYIVEHLLWVTNLVMSDKA